jgi:glucoamylase
MKMIIDEFIFGNFALEKYIDEYIKAQAILQTVRYGDLSVNWELNS